MDATARKILSQTIILVKNFCLTLRQRVKYGLSSIRTTLHFLAINPAKPMKLHSGEEGGKPLLVFMRLFTKRADAFTSIYCSISL